MNTRIGTCHFVHLNAAIRYYAVQEKGNMKPNDIRKMVAKKITSGEIQIGMPPKMAGHMIILNNAEGRYMYEEVPTIKASGNVSLNAPAVPSKIDAVPSKIDAVPSRVLESTTTPTGRAVSDTVSHLSIGAVATNLHHLATTAGAEAKTDVTAEPEYCGFCNKPSDQCECVQQSAQNALDEHDGEAVIDTDWKGAEAEGVSMYEMQPGRTGEAEGTDRHRETAAQMFGVPYAEVTAEQRAAAKQKNFFSDYTPSATPSFDTTVHIKTNNVPRELLFFSELKPKEKAELDYVKEDTNSFFRMKDNVYDAGEFFRIVHPGQTDPHPGAHNDPQDHFKGWDGIKVEGVGFGIVIRYPRIDGDIDPERVVIGTFHIGSAEVKDVRAENNVPNLDAENDVEKLRAFWEKHEGGKRLKDVFPSGGEGTKNAVKDLAHYAFNKVTALELRKKGKIDKAMAYETTCDTIYQALPAWAKAW